MQIPTGLSMMRRAAAGPATIAWARGGDANKPKPFERRRESGAPVAPQQPTMPPVSRGLGKTWRVALYKYRMRVRYEECLMRSRDEKVR